MIEALAASGPHPELAEKLAVLDRLVGSWDIEARFLDADGTVTKAVTGEWHFGWVLEGRVLQDVLIARPNSYDTSLWMYDAELDGWRVTVVAPIGNVTVTMVAHARDDEIRLEGKSPAGDRWRWTFSDFTEDRVRWQGYESKDEGETWRRGEEITLRRRPATIPGPEGG